MKGYIKTADAADIGNLARLARELWPEHGLEELIAEFAEIVTSDSSYVVLQYIDDAPIGFAHCQLRYDYVEGADTTPVGYLEGVYVKREFRHNGYARGLLQRCESWAKSRGCTEFASDCELHNAQSLQFHLANGFREVNRIICFKKTIQ